jgi:carbon monoxide dehydrogenase subunit G
MALHLSLEEEIAATPGRVFSVLVDLDGAARWMPNFVRIERLTESRFGVGTRWREVRKMFGWEASEVLEITGYEPERSLELFIDGTKGSSRRGQFRFRYDLTPAGPKTRLTLSGEVSGMGRVMELLGRLFMGPMNKALAKDLVAMKRCIES